LWLILRAPYSKEVLWLFLMHSTVAGSSEEDAEVPNSLTGCSLTSFADPALPSASSANGEWASAEDFLQDSESEGSVVSTEEGSLASFQDLEESEPFSECHTGPAQIPMALQGKRSAGCQISSFCDSEEL
jgi:hypothetical protein